MYARVISVCNQKGGCGKTTVSMQLGGTLALRGYKVLVVDGDDQGSALEWASLAPEGVSFPAQVVSLAKAGRKIHQEVKRFLPDYNYIIIDCPPSAESSIAKSALLISDLVLVPFIPGALDMLASTKIREVIEDAQVLNPDLISRLLINRTESNTNLTQIITEMIKNFGMQTLLSKLSKRTTFGESVLSGATVHIFKGKGIEAIKEVENLTNEVINILQGEHGQ